MSKIEKMCQPLNKHEDDFIIMISKFSGIGYGRMKQIITGVWANFLMESSTMSEQSALLGALDLDTWIKQENLKLQHQLEIQTKRVENLKKYVKLHLPPIFDSECEGCRCAEIASVKGLRIDQELEKELEGVK